MRVRELCGCRRYKRMSRLQFSDVYDDDDDEEEEEEEEEESEDQCGGETH